MDKLIGLSGKQVFGVIALSAITTLILIPLMRKEK
jgi:hypothetical protein